MEVQLLSSAHSLWLSSMATLSIVIPAFNEENYIGFCLEAIKSQTVLPDEVIVVNNNSTDSTVKIAQSYPFVTVINESIQGMIPARNSGLNKAKGDLLARIDADTRISKNWVETVHSLLDTQTKNIIGISGPQYFYEINNRILKKVLSHLLSRFGFFTITRLLLGHETLFGSNMVITNRAWQKVKNEVCSDSQKVHEDIDLALHIGQYGRIIYDDRLMVGISDRPLFEGAAKHLWRLRTWITTITQHRKLFVGPKNEYKE